MVHCQQTARPQCPGRRAVRLQGDASAGLGDPTSAGRLFPCCPLPTHQHPHKYRSELGFILLSVIPCSSLNHSNEGMTNSVPLSITDRVTQGSQVRRKSREMNTGEQKWGGWGGEKYLKEGKKEAYLRERGSNTKKMKRCHDYYS